MDLPWIGSIEKNNGKGVNLMIEEYQLPENIDNYIHLGVKKAKRIKKARKISKITSMVAVCLIITLVGAIRISPVFASYAENIPILDYLVKIINDDKGLLSAVQNDFIQKVDKSAEDENIKFTVKDIIVDNANMIVFYSIENKGGYKWPHLANPKLTDAQGKDLEVSVHHGYGPTEEKIYEGRIDYIFVKEKGKPEFVVPDTVIISTTIAYHHNSENEAVKYKPVELSNTAHENTIGDLKQNSGDSQKSPPAGASSYGSDAFDAPNKDISVLSHKYQVPVTIDKSKFKSMVKTYEIAQTVTVENQKITFDKVNIYPTRLEIDLAFAPENTMKIFSFEDLKVIDEQGRAWGTITNGITASLTDDNHRTLYFQSNYFTTPKKLYITGSRIRALDKDKLEVTLDLEGKKFLKVPNDKLTLANVKLEDKKLLVSYNLKSGVIDEKRSYNIFTFSALDSNKNKLEGKTGGSSSADNEGVQNGYNAYTSSTSIKDPVTLTIEDYPNWIESPFRIDVIK